MVRGGADQRFGDLFGQGRFPSECQCPLEPQRFVFRRLSQGQRRAGPSPETIGQGRLRRRRNDLPVLHRARFQLVVDPEVRKISAVIKGPFSRRDLGPVNDSRYFNGLTSEKIRQKFRRRDRDAPGGRLPGLAVELQGGDVDAGHRAPRFFFVLNKNAKRRRFAQRAADRGQRGFAATDEP